MGPYQTPTWVFYEELVFGKKRKVYSMLIPALLLFSAQFMEFRPPTHLARG